MKKKKEKRLYNRWLKSKEEELLNKYVGRPIEEVTMEYREKIEVLRSWGLGLKEKTVYEEVIEFLETHGGKLPRNSISKKKRLFT